MHAFAHIFFQSLPTLQRGLSAIADLRVSSVLETPELKAIYLAVNAHKTYLWQPGIINNIPIYTVNHKKRDILFLTITLANLH